MSRIPEGDESKAHSTRPGTRAQGENSSIFVWDHPGVKVSQFRNPSIPGKVDGWSPYQAGTHIWQQGVKGVLRRPQRSGSSKPDGPEQWRSLAQCDAGKDPSLYISEPLARLGGLRCCSFLFSSLIPSPNFQNIQGLSETLTPRTCSWKRPQSLPHLTGHTPIVQMAKPRSRGGETTGPTSCGELSPVCLTLQVGSRMLLVKIQFTPMLG